MGGYVRPLQLSVVKVGLGEKSEQCRIYTRRRRDSLVRLLRLAMWSNRPVNLGRRVVGERRSGKASCLLDKS
jgi:hypothetical protein